MKCVCMYHRADLDGKCAAAIVRLHCGAPDGEAEDLELVGCDHGDPAPAMPPEGVPVYVVDFSWPIPVMQALAARGPLVWIDHHVSSIRDAEAAGFDPLGIRRIGSAGCELAWEWFYPREDQPTMTIPAMRRYFRHPRDPLPEAVRLLGRYDVWDDKDPRWADEILPFQYGMRLHRWFPADQAWATLLINEAADGYIWEIRAKGAAILEYQREQDAVTMQRAFETDLDGHRCLAVNTDRLGSHTFESAYDPAKHDAMLAFQWRPGAGWRCGLYTTRDDVDCSAIAKAHGGGGHRQAAGFVCAELPFPLETGRSS